MVAIHPDSGSLNIGKEKQSCRAGDGRMPVRPHKQMFWEEP